VLGSTSELSARGPYERKRRKEISQESADDGIFTWTRQLDELLSTTEKRRWGHNTKRTPTMMRGIQPSPTLGLVALKETNEGAPGEQARYLLPLSASFGLSRCVLVDIE
jgi:hypothetical protein